MNNLIEKYNNYEQIEKELDEYDNFTNAPSYRKLRGIFSDIHEEEIFNKFCKLIADDILNLHKELSGYQDGNIKKLDVFKKFSKFNDKRQKCLLSKVEEVTSFLNYKCNLDLFTDQVKEIITDLVYNKIINKYIRYSRNCNEFYGNGRYKFIKNYSVYIFIIDALELFDIIENIIGDRYKERESRMRLSEAGMAKFKNIPEPIKFDEILDGKLIILRKEIVKIVNNKEKIIKTPVLYKIDKTIHNKLEVIKQVNKINSNNKVCVKAENLEIVTKKDNNVIDDIFAFNLNNYINLIELVCETNSNVNYINYYNKLINDTNLLSVTIRDENLDTPLYNLMDFKDFKRKNIGLGELVPNIISPKEKYFKFDKLSFSINRKSLYRVYSRGEWRYNGRWYGSFIQNMPKSFRKHIYLNDSTKPLVGLDYSGLHPRMAYHIQGIPYADDPYIIDGYGQDYRDHFKIVTLIAMNAANWNDAVVTIMKNLAEEELAYLTHEETSVLLKAFVHHHKPIKHYICSDFGITGMNIDGDIMEDLLYELMIKRGIVVLPVHDELLCHDTPDTIRIVKQQMVDSYRKVMKSVLKKNGVLKKYDDLPDHITPVIKQG